MIAFFKKYWLSIRKALSIVCAAVLICIGIVVIIAILPLPNNIRFLNVMSGSMSPTIPTGSLIVIRPVNEYKVDDIITFHTPEADEPDDYTTHRIYEIKSADNPVQIVTKGDANNGPDGSTIEKIDIVGKLYLTLPLLGYLFAFIKTLPGLIVCVIIPSIFIIIVEIRRIVTEIKAKQERKSIPVDAPKDENSMVSNKEIVIKPTGQPIKKKSSKKHKKKKHH